MDDNGDDLFRPSFDDVRTAFWDLVVDCDQFAPQLLGLCRRVGSGSIGTDTTGEYDPVSGALILVLALVAVADLPPWRGRSVSAEHAELGGDNEPWFYVARRCDGRAERRRHGCCWRCRVGIRRAGHRGRTRLRIWVPRTADERWLAEFDGGVLKALQLED
jgi:hypothetical protein